MEAALGMIPYVQNSCPENPPPSTNLHLKIIMLLQRAEEPSPGYKEGLSEG